MDPLAIQVIATTTEGTRTALATARGLSLRLPTASIVLVVPRLMRLPISSEGPAETSHAAAHYRELARAAGVHAIVRLCICRRYREAIRWMLGSPSLIVIGGRRRWWWPTPAQRITRDLTRAGHQVIFAAVR